jgi:hypothetical protein
MEEWKAIRNEWVKRGGNGPLVMPQSKKTEDHIEYWVTLMRFKHGRVETLELMNGFGYPQKQLNQLRLAMVTMLPPPETDAPVRGIKSGYEEKPKQSKIAIPPPYPRQGEMPKNEGIRVTVRCANSGANVFEGEMDV